MTKHNKTQKANRDDKLPTETDITLKKYENAKITRPAIRNSITANNLQKIQMLL